MNNTISYSEDFEILLKQEAEKAEAMSILHNKSYQKFSKLSIMLNIPVIVEVVEWRGKGASAACLP